MQGIPFHVDMDSTGEFLLTMGGPFGITAARMYAAADTFLMVNYLMQEVWFGDPNAPQLRTASHFPMPAGDLMQLIRGRAPGNPARFRQVPHSSTDLLFACRDSTGVEYLLVDTTSNILKQYQRKDTSGTLVMDVAFQDVREENGILIPHRILVNADDRQQHATVELRTVTLNQPLPKPPSLSVPSEFPRRSFR
jgi:hypothetical protein